MSHMHGIVGVGQRQKNSEWFFCRINFRSKISAFLPHRINTFFNSFMVVYFIHIDRYYKEERARLQPEVEDRLLTPATGFVFDDKKQSWRYKLHYQCKGLEEGYEIGRASCRER